MIFTNGKNPQIYYFLNTNRAENFSKARAFPEPLQKEEGGRNKDRPSSKPFQKHNQEKMIITRTDLKLSKYLKGCLKKIQ